MTRSSERPAASGGTASRSMLAGVPLSSGAVVMGTGIVSIGLRLDGQYTPSRILLVIAASVLVALVLAIADRWRRDPRRLIHESRLPSALSVATGMAVVGNRLVLLGWKWAGATMLALASVAWLGLLRGVLVSWVTPTTGASLMLVVSTQSLAVLAAAVGARTHAVWLLGVGLVLLVLGLVAYAFVMASFDYRCLIAGRGDHWIAGGALAISTLAAGQITLAHQLGSLEEMLKVTTVVLWAATMAWLPVLLVAEARRPRLGYHPRRWSTVFPIGMYAACSFLAGEVTSAPAITDFARVWIWVALAVWLVVSVGTLRYSRVLLRPSA